VRVVLLDAMGTLVELEDPVPRLSRGLRERAGIEVGEPACEAALMAEISFYRAHHLRGGSQAGLGALRRDCARVLRDALGPRAAGAQLSMTVEVLLDALRFRAHADAQPALSSLRARGLRLAVVSNWDVGLDAVLDRLGLRAHLDAVVTSAAVGAAKPDPRVFRRALAGLGCPAGAAVHVGDRMHEDVAGARAAGVHAVLLDRGGGPIPAGVASVRGLVELDALIS